MHDRGSPSCAPPRLLRLTILPGAKWDRRSRPAGYAPGRAGSKDRGQAPRLCPFAGPSPSPRTPCVAWAPAQAFLRSRCPALLERPGRAVRGTPVHRAKGPLDPLQCPGSPMAWAFAGTSVRRTLALFRLTHWTVVFLRRTHRTLALPHSPTRLSADSAAGWYTGYWESARQSPVTYP